MSAPPALGRADRRRPSLPTFVSRALADDHLWDRGARVLVAVSGGQDSSALLHVLAGLRRRLGFELVACGVDHGLREEAASELARVRELSEAADVPFELVNVAVEPGGNLQARARSARHAALREVADRRGAQVIATGHTANDRAETVLSRLLRGAGPRGLAVLPPRDGRLVRPLVRALRSDVEAYVVRHALRCSEDPSNVDTRFQRVQIRRDLLPLMQSMAPRIVFSLCDLADALAPLHARQGPLDGLNAAQRKAITAAAARGRSSIRLLVSGGREVEVTLGHDPAGPERDVPLPDADPTTGGSSVSRNRDPHVFSQSGAFPPETAVLIQGSTNAAARRGRRRS